MHFYRNLDAGEDQADPQNAPVILREGESEGARSNGKIWRVLGLSMLLGVGISLFGPKAAIIGSESLGAWISAKSWLEKSAKKEIGAPRSAANDTTILDLYSSAVWNSFSKSELKGIFRADKACEVVQGENLASLSPDDETDNGECWGSPFLYVTYHGGFGKERVKTVCKYSRNGCSLGAVTLPEHNYKEEENTNLKKKGNQQDEEYPSPDDVYVAHSLRGMLIEKDFLYVAEAWKRNSRILQYSPCLPKLNNKRAFVKSLITSSAMHEVDNNTSIALQTATEAPEKFDGFEEVAELMSPNRNLNPIMNFTDNVAQALALQPNGMIHPYGFARSPLDSYVYVSSQDTFTVLRYSTKSGKAGPVSKGILKQYEAIRNMSLSEIENQYMSMEYSSAQMRDYAKKEALRKANNDKLYAGLFVDLEGHEIRGIAFDRLGNLYVADKNQGVRIYDPDGFEFPYMLDHVERPLSLYYCKDRDSIWASCAATHKLYEFDVATHNLKQSLREDTLLEHPAGLTTYKDSLYVVSQAKDKMLKFSMSRGVLEGVVFENLPDVGERVLLSKC